MLPACGERARPETRAPASACTPAELWFDMLAVKPQTP